MNARTERFAEALTSDWHDATCPEGKDCRDRDLHSRGLSWPATLTKVIEQGAVIGVADAEHAPLSAEVEEYRAKKFAPMSRIHRAERVAENAVADKRAAEAERDRLRISPDHLEEMLGIDPNDPLNKLARYGVEQRRRAEDAEAELARYRALHESVRAKADETLIAERDELRRPTIDDSETLDRAADGIEAYFGEGCTEYVLVVKWLRSRAAHARMEKFAAQVTE